MLGVVGAAIFFVVWRRKKEAVTDGEYADSASLVDEMGAYNMDDSVRATATATVNGEVEGATATATVNGEVEGTTATATVNGEVEGTEA